MSSLSQAVLCGHLKRMAEGILSHCRADADAVQAFADVLPNLPAPTLEALSGWLSLALAKSRANLNCALQYVQILSDAIDVLAQDGFFDKAKQGDPRQGPRSSSP